MAFKVILLVAVVAVARAGNLGIPIFGYDFAPYVHGNPVAESQPLLNAALRAHAIFLNFLGDIVPLRYNWGYEVVDPRTGETRSQFESRYGDLVHGSYTLLKTDRTGITLFYSVDDLNREISALRTEPAVATHHLRFAAPTIGVDRAAPVTGNDDLAAAAARYHAVFIKYYRDAVPTRYSWEYDVQDPVTGDNMSQYQSRYDDVAKGSYTLAKPDKSSRTIYYSVDNNNRLVVDRAETSDVVLYTSASQAVSLLYPTQLF